MTKHWYDDEAANVSVMIGWDKPLQYFYCVVYSYRRNKDEIEDHLYSNLDEVDGIEITDLTRYQRMLKDLFNVTLPETLVTQLIEDQLNNLGEKRSLPFLT
jgi:hypothetical protein